MSESDLVITDGVVVQGPKVDGGAHYFIANRVDGVNTREMLGTVASYNGRRWKILRIADEPTSYNRVRVWVEEVT